MNQPLKVPPEQRAPSMRQIKPLDPKEFGKKAELRDKLKAILKDVPKLHERLVIATAQYEKVIAEVIKTNNEFKDATVRAQAIVSEWEKLNEGESP